MEVETSHARRIKTMRATALGRGVEGRECGYEERGLLLGTLRNVEFSGRC